MFPFLSGFNGGHGSKQKKSNQANINNLQSSILQVLDDTQD